MLDAMSSRVILALIVLTLRVLVPHGSHGSVQAPGDRPRVENASTSPLPDAGTIPTTPPTPAPDLAPSAHTINVPWYPQAYTLSCEEASLRMALAHEGISTTDAAILDIIGTDARPATFVNGVLRWGDPFVAFVGDPNGSEAAFTGYGTYYPTIARAAIRLGGQVLRAGQGIAPADVYDAILQGHPVVAWVTYQWVTAVRADYLTFDGRMVPYAGPIEHAVAVVGVQEHSVLVNNPGSGPEWVSKSTFETAYSAYDEMAVIIA